MKRNSLKICRLQAIVYPDKTNNIIKGGISLVTFNCSVTGTNSIGTRIDLLPHRACIIPELFHAECL